MRKRWYENEAVQFIVAYVRWRRKKERVVLSRGRKPELSCEMFGEFWNLLEIQLLTTPEFEDGWLELRATDEDASGEIVAGLLKEIGYQLSSIKVDATSSSLIKRFKLLTLQSSEK